MTEGCLLGVQPRRALRGDALGGLYAAAAGTDGGVGVRCAVGLPVPGRAGPRKRTSVRAARSLRHRLLAELHGRDGCCTPMPWTAGEKGGFTTGRPAAGARAPRAQRRYSRRTGSTSARYAVPSAPAEPALQEASASDTPDGVTFLREYAGERLLIAFNLSAADATSPQAPPTPAVDLPGFDPGTLADGRLRLPAYGVFYGRPGAARGRAPRRPHPVPRHAGNVSRGVGCGFVARGRRARKTLFSRADNAHEYVCKTAPDDAAATTMAARPANVRRPVMTRVERRARPHEPMTTLPFGRGKCCNPGAPC